ncbi:hypothetical protein CLOM_g19608 [Closterium sp. NIES-68]|nr:hypothetical protein CLOM_g19608 [Closterium sp. NIES-68]
MNERGGDANGRGAVPEKTSEPPPSKVEALDGSNYEEWSGRMRSAFKRYKLLKIAVGEEKMPEEGEARERWIEKSAVLFDLILQSVNKEMFEHIKDLVEADDSGPRAWKLLRCTSHMTPRADLLDEVKPPGRIKYVAAASGALLPVIGVGNAKVKGANGELVGLGNVLLVEGLSANLFSVRRLQKSKAQLVKNACLHGLTKHIRPKWHWVRRFLDKEVRLEIVKTHQQAADIFTKRLAEADHWKGMKLAGMSVH